jgi:hypothetical protein
MGRLSAQLAGGVVAVVMSLAIPLPAAAHFISQAGPHEVHAFGTLTIAVGWLHEPAYAGEDNAVQVVVKQGDAPLRDITAKDITAQVSLGNQSMNPQSLIPGVDPTTGLGTPGEYEMHFIPTIPGDYTFHIKGTITGIPIDESVTAGPTTFDEVKSPAEAEFPTVVPTNAELATRLDKTAPRIQAVEDSARQDANAAGNNADRALIVGIVALVLAMVAVVVGLQGRRHAASSAATPPGVPKRGGQGKGPSLSRED